MTMMIERNDEETAQRWLGEGWQWKRWSWRVDDHKDGKAVIAVADIDDGNQERNFELMIWNVHM